MCRSLRAGSQQASHSERSLHIQPRSFKSPPVATVMLAPGCSCSFTVSVFLHMEAVQNLLPPAETLRWFFFLRRAADLKQQLPVGRISTDLLLVLQKLLLLVVVKLLELLELVVLLQGEMSLVLLKITAYRPLVPLTGRAPCSTAATCRRHKTRFTTGSAGRRDQRRGRTLTGGHDVGARGR